MTQIKKAKWKSGGEVGRSKNRKMEKYKARRVVTSSKHLRYAVNGAHLAICTRNQSNINNRDLGTKAPVVRLCRWLL